ncbi:MAG: ABC transporter permease [Deltaproteobacteria bacterium]|nr:ABC transporter permease [Deltaproteobacteria bacterium]
MAPALESGFEPHPACEKCECCCTTGARLVCAVGGLRVSIWKLALRNIVRTPVRTLLTVIGVASSVAGFCFLQALSDGLQAGMMSTGGNNRLTVYGLLGPIPQRFTGRLTREFPELSAVSCYIPVGLLDKNDRFVELMTTSDDGSTVPPYFDAPPAQLEAWRNDPQGILMTADTAERWGVRVGDSVNLFASGRAREFRLNVSGIVKTPPGQTQAPRIHWKFATGGATDERCATLWGLVKSGQNPTDVSRRIDAFTESSEAATRTFPDRGLRQAILRTYHSLFTGINIMSLVLAVIGVTLLGNALSLNIGERTREFAVFRSIGFVPSTILRMVLVETSLVYGAAVVGGAGFGVLLTRLFGAFARKNAAWLFPSVWVRAEPLIFNAGCMLLLIMALAVASAHRAASVNLVDALRGIG